MDKKELRRCLKDQVLSLATDEFHLKSNSLSKHLYTLLEKLKSEHSLHSLGVFSPLRDEPIWWKSWEQAPLDLLLVHVKSDADLSFHSIEFENLKKMKTSLKLADELTFREETPSLLLVPGLGFDRNFDRLGRGGGFYDRYLENFPGIKIGVFFAEQEVDDVKAESHDEKLDFIVTDKEILIKE